MSEAVTNEDGSKTLVLAYPVQVGERTITTVQLRRPRGKDLRIWDQAKGDVQRNALMIGALSGLSQPEVDLLDAADFMTLAQALSDFLPGARATGES